jgi:hypothetical protein
MESLTRREQRHSREWELLKTMRPDSYELSRLRAHLQYLRLPAEAKLKTEWLPGMGRRHDDR